MDGRDAEIIAALKSGYEAVNRGDFEALVPLAHPDIEVVRPGGLTPIRGVAEVRTWMQPDAFDEQRVEPLDFEVHGNRVLVRQRVKARGAGSGIELEADSWTVWTLNDEGLVVRGEGYLEHQEAEARRAAGFEGE
jgi:ketosteroid isomerase-like protein